MFLCSQVERRMTCPKTEKVETATCLNLVKKQKQTLFTLFKVKKMTKSTCSKLISVTKKHSKIQGSIQMSSLIWEGSKTYT